MKIRRALSALALAFSAITFAGSDAPVHAQMKEPPTVKASAAEEEALRLLRENKLIAARTKSEEILAQNPDSIVANFVLGSALREAEGDLARAMFRLSRARELFERRYGASPPQSAPWGTHRDILQAIASLAGEMEEYDYQLQILDFHDALYQPQLVAAHAWPLLRLGKFDAARRAAKDAISRGDRYEQSIGRNALCAIECEAHERKLCFEACLDSLEAAKRGAEKGTIPVVDLYNASYAAFTVLRLDEVERLAKEGTASRPLTIANPWRILTRLYMDGGRVAEAVAAAKQMQTWRSHQPASFRDQDRADTDGTLAMLLLVAGETTAAERLVTRAIDRPDRKGLVSSKPDQALGAHALLRRSIAATHAQRVAERASWSGTKSRPKAAAEALLTRAASLADDERIASILANGDRLETTFRPYLNGGLEPVPTWLAPDLVEVIGPGVAGVALSRAREKDKAEPLLVPYFDAMEAEIAFRRGDEERTIALARKAIEKLPKAEGMLAARMAAIGGEAARRRGDRAAALALLEQALQKDAGVIRRLGLSIPTKVSGSGDAAVDRAVVLLGRSPRLRESDWGFSLKVRRVEGGLEACLRTANDTLLKCASVAPAKPEKDKPPEEPEDFAARLVEQFHREAFAMRVGMTVQDMNSLDGSTTLASQAQREQLQGVLTDLAKDSE
ncbi:MAG: hypothetical protein JST00_18775 [Deltaproteobacteria bacterium]|nr:hypothetical protein [Deltaproteobacteria bacterium]